MTTGEDYAMRNGADVVIVSVVGGVVTVQTEIDVSPVFAQILGLGIAIVTADASAVEGKLIE